MEKIILQEYKIENSSIFKVCPKLPNPTVYKDYTFMKKV